VPCQVVGVAKNARTRSLRGAVAPRYFLAAAQRPSASSSPFLLIRTTVESPFVMAAVRSAIQRIDASLPIMSAASIEDQLAPLTAQDRTTARLALVFGFVALAIAAVGLYGLVSYGVVRRTAEIAIRIALGAQTRRVMSMILHETLGLVAFGLVVGAAFAYVASRLIASRLYGVAPQDPITFALAIAVLVLVSLGAAYWPARRASRLDPMAALRQY